MSITNPKPRLFNIQDPKWGHPELTGVWESAEALEMAMAAAAQNPDDPYVAMNNPALSDEEKDEIYQKVDLSAMTNDDFEGVTVERYEAPGCPEEPDASVEIRVYRPEGAAKRNGRCIFYCLGGGMGTAWPELYPLSKIAVRHGCVLVVPIYRVYFQGRYPAAINDLHAGYAWTIDNAELLGINTDKVVIMGLSSGGHLAASLPFRIMRYGYSPRGVVAEVPIVDDRSSGDSNLIFTGMWDGPQLHVASANWMGARHADPSVGPEAYANHATVDDCIGYPPLFVHTGELDPDRDACTEFVNKVLAAKSFVEYHVWGGRHHGLVGVDTPESRLIESVLDKNIDDCLEYDLRRPWVQDE